MTLENKQSRISLDPAGVPEELRMLPRWICWRYEVRDGKETKVPISPKAGKLMDATQLANGHPFAEALQALEKDSSLAGIGFLLGEGITGIDLDDCIDEHGTLSAPAQGIVYEFASYTEYSPSGTGVKIFIRGNKSEGVTKCASTALPGMSKIEVYDKKRFFAVTGHRVENTPATVNDSQAALDRLCAGLWSGANPKPQTAASVDKHAAGFVGSDDELIRIAMSAKNGAKFNALWNADTSGHGNDDSVADLALCSMLAFWTGNDSARIDLLFRRSGLYRQKWERDDYRNRTIAKAIESCREAYQGVSRDGSRQHVDLRAPTRSPVDGIGSIDPVTGRFILSPKQTLPTAMAFVEGNYSQHGQRSLVFHAGEFLHWRCNRYVPIEANAIRHQLYAWLHEALRVGQNGVLVPFDANSRTVDSAVDAVRAHVHLDGVTTVPSWLIHPSGLPKPTELVSCRSSNVHIPTRRVLPATPSLFTTCSLDFEFDPHAPEPTKWLSFLRDLWGEDHQSVELLQEWFGYSLTADTSQQKMLLIIGPKRCGKGTIARVLTGLLGKDNVASPTPAGLVNEFGLQSLIGKSVAIMGDAKFSCPNVGIAMERMLAISGEDAITINRKYLGAVTLRLPTRIVVLTNDIPEVPDASGAWLSRFLVLRLTETFLGRENLGLTEELLEELPGILLWAMEGFDRLKGRGRFVPAASSSQITHEMEVRSSPILSFVAQCCDVGAGARVEVEPLYGRYLRWLTETGSEQKPSRQQFGKDLLAAVPTVNRRRGTAASFYDGIDLKSDDATTTSAEVPSRTVATVAFVSHQKKETKEGGEERAGEK